MAKKVEFFGGKTRKDSAEPFKWKMTPEKSQMQESSIQIFRRWTAVMSLCRLGLE